MKQAVNLIANCPPYLLVVGGFVVAVAGGLWKLHGMLQGLGLGA